MTRHGTVKQAEAGPSAIAIVTGGSSGPPEAGSPHTQLYRQTFGRLAKSGVRVVGYLHVSYGRRPLQQALAAVRDWYAGYGDLLSGVFVDEVPSEVRRTRRRSLHRCRTAAAVAETEPAARGLGGCRFQ